MIRFVEPHETLYELSFHKYSGMMLLSTASNAYHSTCLMIRKTLTCPNSSLL